MKNTLQKVFVTLSLNIYFDMSWENMSSSMYPSPKPATAGDYIAHTLNLTGSVLLAQLWTTFLIQKTFQGLTLYGWSPPHESFVSLVLVTALVWMCFHVTNQQPQKVIGGVNFYNAVYPI